MDGRELMQLFHKCSTRVFHKKQPCSWGTSCERLKKPFCKHDVHSEYIARIYCYELTAVGLGMRTFQGHLETCEINRIQGLCAVLPNSQSVRAKNYFHVLHVMICRLLCHSYEMGNEILRPVGHRNMPFLMSPRRQALRPEA